MKSLIVTAIILCCAANLPAAILPPDRSIEWSPGVEGGIPRRTLVFADVTQPPYNAPKKEPKKEPGTLFRYC